MDCKIYIHSEYMINYIWHLECSNETEVSRWLMVINEKLKEYVIASKGRNLITHFEQLLANLFIINCCIGACFIKLNSIFSLFHQFLTFLYWQVLLLENSVDMISRKVMKQFFSNFAHIFKRTLSSHWTKVFTFITTNFFEPIHSEQ